MANIAERTQRLVAGFLQRQAGNGQMESVDPLNIGMAFMELTARICRWTARARASAPRCA